MNLEKILKEIGLPRKLIDEIINWNNNIDKEKVIELVNNYLQIVNKNYEKMKINNWNICEKIIKIETIIEHEKELNNAEKIINNI